MLIEFSPRWIEIEQSLYLYCFWMKYPSSFQLIKKWKKNHSFFIITSFVLVKALRKFRSRCRKALITTTLHKLCFNWRNIFCYAMTIVEFNSISRGADLLWEYVLGYNVIITINWKFYDFYVFLKKSHCTPMGSI